jgi:hypothetical protein
MENKTEDEIRKRWEQEAKDKAERDDEVKQRPKKRARAIEYQQASGSLLQDEELEEVLGFGSSAKARGAPRKKTGRVAAGRAKGKVTEILEEEDTVVELD